VRGRDIPLPNLEKNLRKRFSPVKHGRNWISAEERLRPKLATNANADGDNSGHLCPPHWYHVDMDFPNTSPIAPMPTEASQGPGHIVIAEANASPLAEALAIARETGVALGKSTLQRWAKVWTETAGSPVKALLQVTRNGRHYEIVSARVTPGPAGLDSWAITQRR
jgi:hypothetical protein